MDNYQRDEIMRAARETLERLDDADRDREIQARENRLAEQFSATPNPGDRRAWHEWLNRVAPPEASGGEISPAEPKQEDARVLQQQMRGLAKGVAEEIAGLNVALRAHVEARMGALTEMIATVIGEESGRNEKLLRDEYDAAIAELRTEIAVLREELNLCKRAAKPVNLGVTEIIDLDRLEGLGHG